MEKKKAGITDVTLESDKQFLERTGVNHQIKDALTKIVENRPEDPVDFLVDYFDTLGGQSDRVPKMYQQLCQTHHSKPAFHVNVRQAYDTLLQNKAVDRRGRPVRKDAAGENIEGRQLKGLNGTAFSELLSLLCKELPPSVRERLYKKIQCRDYEVVMYDVFKSVVFTCFVLKDYLQQAKSLYESLDLHRNNKVDRAVCEVLIQQLSSAVGATEPDNLASILEGGHMLGPGKIYSNLGPALMSGKEKKTMCCDEFVIASAESFLTKVQTMK